MLKKHSTPTAQTAQPQDTNTIQNGIIPVDYGVHAIVINGRQVDVCHGDPVQAQEQRQEWLETLATDNIVEQYLDTPFDELPDSYFRNGHVKPLCLETEDDIFSSALHDTILFTDSKGDTEGWSIPFMAEPCYAGDPDADDYGLAVSYA